jgi:SAM-dependent methyltransferase
VYSTDLAYIHDAGFAGYAERAAPELIRTLRRHGIGRGRLVDVGCGSGTLARRLVDAGYDVVGIDLSPAMIRLARANVPQARFRVGSFAGVALPRCRAVIAIGEVVTYLPEPQPGPARLERFFARVYRALAPGGLFLFDFMESAERRTYPPKSRSGTDWAVVLRADSDRSGRRLVRHITTFRKIGGEYRRSQETHVVRIYSRADIAAALTARGFAVRMRRSFGRVRLMAGDVAVIAQRRSSRRR